MTNSSPSGLYPLFQTKETPSVSTKTGKAVKFLRTRTRMTDCQVLGGGEQREII